MQIFKLEHSKAVYRNDLALHHCRIGQPGYYGVSSAFLDHTCGSVRQKGAPVAADRGRHVH